MAVDHKDLIGMVGQPLEASQITQNHLEGHIFANRHQLEIHAGTDRLLGIGQRRTQLLAFLGSELSAHLLDHVVGQVVGNLGKVIGVEGAGGSDQLIAVH